MPRRSALVATLIVAIAGLLGAAAAEAKPRVAGSFNLSGQPGRMTLGPDGNIWVIIQGGTGNLARVKPSGAVKEYSPAALVNPRDITTGPDGKLWVSRNGGVVRVPPANPDNAQDFDIGDIVTAEGITAGPNNRLWTPSGDKLVSFKPGNPAGSAESITINGMNPRGITASGGRLWIADFGGQRIVRVTPSGAVKRFKTNGGPQEVAPGPKGAIAYADPGAVPQKVGIITPNGKQTRRQVPDSDPFGIDFAADKRWWFAQFADNQLGMLSQKGKLRKLNLPNNSGPRYLAAGKNRTVWVGLETAEKIVRIKGL